MDIHRIAEKTLIGKSRPHHKVFRELLRNCPQRKEFRKLQTEHPDLKLRGQYLAYCLGARPKCVMCRDRYTSFSFREGQPKFAKYCGPACSNAHIDKIYKGSKSLKETCERERAVVANIFKKYKSNTVSSLSSGQIRAFRAAVSSNGGQPREYDILKRLTPELRAVWVNLPCTKPRQRLLLATGKAEFGAACRRCGEPVKLGFYGYSEYCSSKCATLSTAQVRITKESIAKTKITMRKRHLSGEGKEVYLGKVSKGVRAWGSKLHGGYPQYPNLTNNDVRAHAVKAGMLYKYGVTNPSNLAWVRKKQLASGHSTKPFTLGSRDVRVQGYEDKALTYLLRYYNPDELRVASEGRVPVIRYTYNGKERQYYPDLFIPKENRIVEVKSIATLAKSAEVWDMNKAKFAAVKAQGYTFGLLVMRPNGSWASMPRGLAKLSHSQILNYYRASR